MNAKQTALDAYLARTAAIYAKLERLQQLADGANKMHGVSARQAASTSVCLRAWHGELQPERRQDL